MHISIPKEWKAPRFHMGQDTSRGKIVGMFYVIPGSPQAAEVGQGWFYMFNKNHQDAVHVRESDLLKSEKQKSSAR